MNDERVLVLILDNTFKEKYNFSCWVYLGMHVLSMIFVDLCMDDRLDRHKEKKTSLIYKRFNWVELKVKTKSTFIQFGWQTVLILNYIYNVT